MSVFVWIHYLGFSIFLIVCLQKILLLTVDTINVEPGVEDVEFGSKKQQFTYSEIQRITSNFQRVLGEGGFGKVYHGYLNGNEVAVKMISASSIQGHRQFLAEVG